ncbi:MAG: GH25 family lysozyme [Oscillospiraceae bacterium]
MHQAGIDVASVPADFVIIKATEGTGYTDPQFHNHVEKAIAAGKRIGLYHFARNDLANTASAEADWFISVVKNFIGKAVLALDWEAPANISDVAYAKAWLDRVYEQTGIRPLIYMSQSPANAYNWADVVAGNYGLWVANYGPNDGNQHDISIKHWGVTAIHQYTSVGRLPGYGGNLDLNVFNGDGLAWDKYTGGSDPAPTPPKPIPAPESGFKVGDIVQPIRNVSYEGVQLIASVLQHTYPVTQITGNRIVLGNGLNTAFKDANLRKVHAASAPYPIGVGSRVRVKKGSSDFNGGSLASFVYEITYTVMEMKDNRCVVGNNGTVTAAIHLSNLYLA